MSSELTGITWSAGQRPDAAALQDMTARLESEVAVPLAGVQQSLAAQVAFWDHSSTLSTVFLGLYTVPKARPSETHASP